MTDLEQFCAWLHLAPEAFRDWEAHPFVENGATTAIAILQGSTIHFAASPEHRHRVIQRHRTREFLAPLLERLGFLTTSSARRDAATHRFLVGLGFVHTWTDPEGIAHYMLTELPFGKEQ